MTQPVVASTCTAGREESARPDLGLLIGLCVPMGLKHMSTRATADYLERGTIMQSNQSITGVREARSIVASPIDDGAQPLHAATLDVRRSPTLKDTASAVGKFLLHFLEMVIAMGVGMA